MSKEISVIDSIPFSEIIFLVASGSNYAKEIADKRKVEVFPTTIQLNKLKERGYLISLNEKENKNFGSNKKLYEVNWDKILKEFLTYLEKEAEENEKLSMLLVEKHEKSERDLHQRFNKERNKRFNERKNKILNNPLIKEFISKVFIKAGEEINSQRVPIKELFHEIIIHFAVRYEEDSMYYKEDLDIMAFANMCLMADTKMIFKHSIGLAYLDLLEEFQKETLNKTREKKTKIKKVN